MKVLFFCGLSRAWRVVLLMAVLGQFPAPAAQTVGVFLNLPEASPGHTLFCPLQSKVTYLINNQGELLHRWKSDYVPGNSYYLKPNGNLVRMADPGPPVPAVFVAGGDAGLVQEFDWDGNLVWEFTYNDADQRAHHDIALMTNGNILMIAWEFRSQAECIAAGRDPALLEERDLFALWPEKIVEIEPAGANGGTVVWEWHSWDHLIQDFDPTKENYGVVGDHPELIDINFTRNSFADWHHANSIDYNETLDQILISIPTFGELWVIDHSTTTEEAAGHTGGARGRGGDLLYRWGNPQTYGAGTEADQKWFFQHGGHWIRPGLPGEGNILVFNNGNGRPEGNYSTVEEIIPPLDATGAYTNEAGKAFGPSAPTWIYTADPPTDLFSGGLSGADRRPNGNTLICEGATGSFFEVTASGETVWDYVSPIDNTGPVAQGSSPVRRQTFRAPRYAPDFPGFAGRDLTPQGLLELDPGAVFAMASLTVTSSGVQARWNSVPGRSYSLQYRPTLSPADPWVAVATREAIGTSTTLTDSDPDRTALPSGFYRVEEL